MASIIDSTDATTREPKMSVTFQSHDAPRTEQEVDDGDGQLVIEMVSVLPSVNVSNATADRLAMLFDLPYETRRLEGELSQQDLDRVIANGMRIINTAEVRAYVVDAADVGGKMQIRSNRAGLAEIGRGARFVDMGCSEERIVRRAGDLLDLFKRARAGGYTVAWG